ncbi:MAG: serine/threonine protein kinase [Candidatus Eremiobacteraeota bacterium]|nr:serine/threonine protein kinase [Candidatus Eremiobacteraeota bacterium]
MQSEDKQIDMKSLKGKTIAGHYRLDNFLDEGAFGAVYRASHIAYGVELREVAVKLSKRPLKDDSKAREVFRDAPTMASIAESTPDLEMKSHFVTVYDAGRCPEGEPLAGHPYIVMEFIPTGSLKRCIKAGRFPLTRTMRYFDQILRAVAFMHTEVTGGKPRDCIIHRDLKPDNILVAREENSPDIVKLTDFGIAIETGTLLGWVESGGDLAYLAPESFSHNICSPQSDVYAMGLIFYEMLTGRNPFSEVGSHLKGTNEEKRKELRRIHLEARRMEKFRLLEDHEEISRHPEIGKIIRTTLQVDMIARKYRNACELLEAWERARKGEIRIDDEKPWETVLRLTGEAEQCLALGEYKQATRLLEQAMEINRNSTQVPDPMVVGKCYLMTVTRLLEIGKNEEAGKLAFEGYHRRKCPSTCKAMEGFYRSQKSKLASRFQRESQECEDRE